jgi:hypothetical protein
MKRKKPALLAVSGYYYDREAGLVRLVPRRSSCLLQLFPDAPQLDFVGFQFLFKRSLKVFQALDQIGAFHHAAVYGHLVPGSNHFHIVVWPKEDGDLSRWRPGRDRFRQAVWESIQHAVRQTGRAINRCLDGGLLPPNPAPAPQPSGPMSADKLDGQGANASTPAAPEHDGLRAPPITAQPVDWQANLAVAFVLAGSGRRGSGKRTERNVDGKEETPGSSYVNGATSAGKPRITR